MTNKKLKTHACNNTLFQCFKAYQWFFFGTYTEDLKTNQLFYVLKNWAVCFTPEKYVIFQSN